MALPDGIKCKGFKAFCVAWRKVLRMLCRVHPMTHNDIIATMSEMLCLEIQLNYRFANFYNKCKSQEFQLVRTIIIVASSNPMSPVGTNIKNAQIYKCSYYVRCRLYD